MDNIYDFTIVGATPLSALLAGLLASEHGKKVCWIGNYAHPLRPLRGFDVSVAAITRPETWQLLQGSVPETQRLLTGIIEDRLFEPIDPLLVARTQAGAEMLTHMRGVIAGFGFSIERQPISEIYVDSYQFRDAARIMRRAFTAALPAWLAHCGVDVHLNTGIRTKWSKGRFVTKAATSSITSAQVILADDDAIINQVAVGELAKTLDLVAMSALLTEPTIATASRLVLDSESGFCAHQRANGPLDCVGPFDVATAGSFAGALVKSEHPLRLAGHVAFNALLPKDGAPVFGPLQRNGPVVIAGLGITGAFQAPAIARVLADVASDFENGYFADRKPGRADARTQVAEYLPVERQQPSLKEQAS